MSLFLENLLIFILCFFLFPAGSFRLLYFICFLTVFSTICFKFSIQNRTVRQVLDIIYLVLCLFRPCFLLELPAVFYQNCYKKDWMFLFPAVPILIMNSGSSPDLYHAALFVTAALFSFYFSQTCRKKDELEQMVRELRDDSVEHEIILKEKNQKLIEKQNDDLYIAVLQERNRIAREIHDNVGHLLSRSILQLGALRAICRDDSLKPHLETLNDSLNDAMNNIRNSVHDLHDEAVSLNDAVHSLLKDFDFCPVDLNYQISSQPPKNVKYCFMAIMKEALNNVIKHSNATKVTLSLKEQNAFYQLIIKDNGTSINKNLAFTEGIGLKSMKERVEANKGIIHISNDSGMRIFVTIPR